MASTTCLLRSLLLLHVVCYFYLLNCLVVGKCFGTDPISCFLSVLNSGRCFCYNQFILLMFYVRLLKCSPMLLLSVYTSRFGCLMYVRWCCLPKCLFVCLVVFHRPRPHPHPSHQRRRGLFSTFLLLFTKVLI